MSGVTIEEVVGYRFVCRCGYRGSIRETEASAGRSAKHHFSESLSCAARQLASTRPARG